MVQLAPGASEPDARDAEEEPAVAVTVPVQVPDKALDVEMVRPEGKV
jgi:hypothetical protein